MTARASSGSSSSISSVERLMAANKAGTVLRSPSSAAASAEGWSGATCTPEADPGCDEFTAAASAPLFSRVPHLPQKSDVGGFSALHFAQGLASAFPHFAQKLLADGLSIPHFEQRIVRGTPPAKQATERSYITRCLLPTRRLRHGTPHTAPLTAWS